MKKYLLFLLLSLVLILSGCGAKEPQKAAVPESVTGTTEYSEFLNGFDPTMLPDSFPDSLPDKMAVVSTVHYDRDDAHYDYGTDYVRLRFKCSKQMLSELSSSLNRSGWEGEYNYYYYPQKPESDALADGYFTGSWQNGEYCAVIDTAATFYNIIEPDMPFTISLDVFKSGFTLK